MKAYLKDPARNLAEESDFEKTEDAAHLPLVQLPGGLSSRARALCRAAGGHLLKALLVDLDDTLLDYTGGVDECWLHACEALAGPAGIDPPGLVAAIAETRRWFWSDPGRHRTERADMLRAWTRIAAHALGRMGRADEALAGCIATDFADRRWERMTLFPGVVAALEALRARGVPAGPGHQRRCLPSAAQDRAPRPRALLRRDRRSRARWVSASPKRSSTAMPCPSSA